MIKTKSVVMGFAYMLHLRAYVTCQEEEKQSIGNAATLYVVNICNQCLVQLLTP